MEIIVLCVRLTTLDKLAYLRKNIGDWDKVRCRCYQDILLLLLHVPLHIFHHQVLAEQQLHVKIYGTSYHCITGH